MTDRNELIQGVEQALLQLPQLELKPNHYFAKGLYGRELFMPADTYLTGMFHLKDHLCIVPYGDVTVVTAEGNERIKGPATFTGQAGKRAFYAHTDTLWIAVHSTEETTVEKCEATLVTNDYEEFKRIAGESLCLS